MKTYIDDFINKVFMFSRLEHFVDPACGLENKI